MRFDISYRRWAAWLLSIAIFLLSGCATTQITGWSQESYRSPNFNKGDFTNNSVAILPVIILTQPLEKASDRDSQIVSAPYTPQVSISKSDRELSAGTQDAYQLILSEMLLSKIQTKWAAPNLVSPGDALKRLNDEGLTEAYRRFNRDFPYTGFDKSILGNFGKALHCRFLLVSQAVVLESKPEASVTFVWTFGRKSMLRTVKISAQIWDTENGRQLWEGSGIGYYTLSAYETAPLMEETASQAVDSLIKIMP